MNAVNYIAKSYAVKSCLVQQSKIEKLSQHNAVDNTDCWRIHEPKGKFYDASPELVRKAPIGSTLRYWDHQDGGKTISYRKIAGDIWLDVLKKEWVDYQFINKL